jgi:hemoglobin
MVGTAQGRLCPPYETDQEAGAERKTPVARPAICAATKTSRAIGPTMSNGRLAGTTKAKDMSDRLKAEREAAARRNLLTQDAIERTGITDEMIGELVTRFYGRVREDALLGPVFAVVQNWDEHLAKLRDFWSSVVLMSGRYHGSPMRAHMPLSLVGDHFDRWLDLFEQTAREVCPPPAAALFIDKARRIADSFEMASATIAGRIAAPRHVLRS